MSFDGILSDIITFAPYEGNDFANQDYIEEVAEKIGVSIDEITEYAIKKATEELG